MGDKSGIEWCDATWNPTTGCTKVSQGCKHCYAERGWSRLVHLPAYKGRAFTDVACHPERLDQPLRWNKPRRIFVNSMSDLFHQDVPDAFIDSVFAVMALCPHHTFQVLTKRPERMSEYLKDLRPGRQRVISIRQATGEFLSFAIDKRSAITFPLPNVWLGVSIEDQVTADERIPLLLQTPAAVRWISAEPLLGLVSLEMMPSPYDHHNGWPGTYHSLNGSWWPAVGDYEEEYRHRQEDLVKIDWVVAGGESGPKARPTHPDWFRSLRDQCKAAGVPFLFKQWGEWSPQDAGDGPYSDCAGVAPDGCAKKYSEGYRAPFDDAERLKKSAGVRLDGRTLMWRVGKRAAGRILDGVLHDAYPEVAR